MRAGVEELEWKKLQYEWFQEVAAGFGVLWQRSKLDEWAAGHVHLLALVKGHWVE